jgi:hypothetical protein
MHGAFAAYAPERRPDDGSDTGLGALARRPADAGGAAHVLLDRAIVRLVEVVDQETEALRKRTAVDLKDFNNHKAQGLYELNRALRMLEGTADRSTIDRLAGLRAKLADNQAVLKLHLEAVREISTIMSDAIRDTESDGTYSQSIRGGDWE